MEENRQILGSVNDFFDKLNVDIESRMADKNNDLLSSLNDLRHKALETLRTRTGTADGWAWIAEYMIFHLVRRLIERKLGFQFESRLLDTKKKNEVSHRVFVDPEEKFKLGHSIPLRKLINDQSKMIPKRKPDICLTYHNRIILTIEVKTSVTKPSALQKTLRDLTSIQHWGSSNPKSKSFFVTFGRTLETTKEAILDDYRLFYEAKGRYVGCFDRELQDNPLFQTIDSKGSKMKMLKLEECLTKIEKLLGKLH